MVWRRAILVRLHQIVLLIKIGLLKYACTAANCSLWKRQCLSVIVCARVSLFLAAILSFPLNIYLKKPCSYELSKTGLKNGSMGLYSIPCAPLPTVLINAPLLFTSDRNVHFGVLFRCPTRVSHFKR